MPADTTPYQSRSDASADEVVRPEPGAEPAPGYRLEKLLGRGGFGEVWQAAGPGGVAVALKFVRLDAKAAGFEMRALEMMKGVRHGHLLSLFGVWHRGPFIIVAMELADRSLLDRLQEATAQGQPGIPPAELLGYLHDAARAIDFLNESRHTLDGKRGVGIQHRDVKPHNLLLVGDTVKLADFGLARLLEQSVASHTGAMTPTYAAPEFFRGQTSSQSDQYSLAVTYCHLRGGRPPFAGSPEQLLMGHTQQEPDLTMLAEAERPATARALAKEPGDRWPSCRAFVQALAVAAGAPVQASVVEGTALSLFSGPGVSTPASSVSLTQPAVTAVALPVPRRRRLGLVAAAVVLLALVPFAAWGLWKVLPQSVTATTPAARGAAPALKKDAAAGRPAESPAAPASKAVLGLGVSPNNRNFQAIREDGTVWEWPGSGGVPPPVGQPSVEPLQVLLPSRQVHAVSGMVLSPNLARALSTTPHAVEVWDVDSGQKLRSETLEQDPFGRPIAFEVYHKAFALDGRSFIVSFGHVDSFRRAVLHVDIWDLERGKRSQLQVPQQSASCVALAPESRRALSANKEGVSLWDVATGKQLLHLDRAAVQCMAFAPDGKRFLLGEEFGTVLLVDSDKDKVGRRLEGHTRGVSCLAFSPDGKRALSGSWDGSVRLWDVEAGKALHSQQPHGDRVMCLAFSADGQIALSGDKQGNVTLWRFPIGK